MSNLARWDGASWQSLGGGVDDYVTALAVMPNGDLIVAGGFTIAGGVPCDGMARWNGTSWTSLVPVGSGGGPIHAMVALPNGDLIVAGAFSSIAGIAANNVARFDGATWSALGSGCDGRVFELVLLPSGDVVAGGDFDVAGGIAANHVASWDGTSWSSLGPGIPTPYDLDVQPNGEVVAVTSSSSDHVLRWDGSSWQPVGAVFAHSKFAISAMSNGTLVTCGRMSRVGATPLEGVAIWDGSAWAPPQAGFDDLIAAVEVLSTGEVVGGGHFTLVDGVPTNHIALRTDVGWQSLGSGLNGKVRDIAELPNGDLLVVGQFTQAGGIPANYIARWDGQAWHPFGGGLGYVGECITVSDQGDVFVGGRFATAGGVAAVGVARWDGAASHALGASPAAYANVRTIFETPSGELWIGGTFDAPGGSDEDHVARWDGTAWSAVGSGLPTFGTGYCASLAALPNGDIVAVGFGFSGARWDGSTWTSILAPINAGSKVAVLPTGDLLVADLFGSGILRYEASTGNWSPLAGGVDGGVNDFEMTREGQLVIGGSFFNAGGNGAARFAVLDNTCPALAAPFQTPCSGVAGPIVLTPNGLPWVGATCGATATGIAANALVLGVLGFGEGSTPLASIHPAGIVGCDLLTTPDYVVMLQPVAGEVEMAVQVPLQTSLAGLQFRQQVLQIVLGAGLQIVEIAGSNGIQLTVGDL